MPSPKNKPEDLREACIDEAFSIVEETGVENLSLREVSRRLGVSHQAPYKHFPSRDHILAEIVARAFQDFAAFLEGRPSSTAPNEDLRGMGVCYMQYALANPLKYRLMFNTALPPAKDHPRMMADARHAFSILRDRLAAMELRDVAGEPRSPRLDAMFVWSTIHGMASLLQSDVLESLEMTDEELHDAFPHALARLSLALEPQKAKRQV